MANFEELYNMLFGRLPFDPGATIYEQAAKARERYSRSKGVARQFSSPNEDGVILLVYELATPFGLDSHHVFNTLASRPLQQGQPVHGLVTLQDAYRYAAQGRAW